MKTCNKMDRDRGFEPMDFGGEDIPGMEILFGVRWSRVVEWCSNFEGMDSGRKFSAW
jgi:hypothetical protein